MSFVLDDEKSSWYGLPSPSGSRKTTLSRNPHSIQWQLDLDPNNKRKSDTKDTGYAQDIVDSVLLSLQAKPTTLRLSLPGPFIACALRTRFVTPLSKPLQHL
ncbi:hypothetical protein BDP27DRAFT_559392 [Rhodocollybia butyracea]|uniref:Uncharacterized protein n=1 Tax=Rhodocollybia butyracea TaxID=206335 RepID=A0A9P5TXD9_9AGAR|nr:hypothetical protein BDP27DRAFT_559392 [Rhodocollybia butyracea]